MIAALVDGSFDQWRTRARELLVSHVTPEDVVWSTAAHPSLFSPVGCLATNSHTSASSHAFKVPRRFLQLADLVSCHRDDQKWAALYRVLYRLAHAEPNLLQIEFDPDVHVLLRMRQQVAHDLHRMHAFVRFREDRNGRYVAWHRPDHLIVEKAAPWFAERFAAMRWSILTPDRCAHWDADRLVYTDGVLQSAAPVEDSEEDLWRAYYASTFNPARLNLELCRQHMPARYWRSLPEAPILTQLAKTADPTSQSAHSPQVSAAAYIPAAGRLPVLQAAVSECRACDLHRCATQPVFGEGPQDARIVLVGEQPGDEEDRAGRPFVGPSGQLLNTALNAAGLHRDTLYITSAVKHFRFEERGKRRLHKTASRAQVAACQPWLEAQLAAIRPAVVVCLGNTAVLSVVGRTARLLEERGNVLPHRHAASGALITLHPSFVLRQPDEARRHLQFQLLVEDLRSAARLAA